MTSIFPGYYSYSLRIDTTTSFPTAVVDKLAALMPPDYYFFGHEIGDHTEKPHFQGVVWYKEKVTQKQIVSVRNNLRRYCQDNLEKPQGSKKWQPVSFTVARRNTLASYCTKEHAARTTNLTKEHIAMIPAWKTEKEFKKEKQDKLHDLVTEHIHKNMTYTDFVRMYGTKYYEVYGNYTCVRSMYIKAARKYEILSMDEFLFKIGVISELPGLQEYKIYSENLEQITDDYQTNYIHKDKSVQKVAWIR